MYLMHFIYSILGATAFILHTLLTSRSADFDGNSSLQLLSQLMLLLSVLLLLQLSPLLLQMSPLLLLLVQKMLTNSWSQKNREK
jgi:hypothetical protein